MRCRPMGLIRKALSIATVGGVDFFSLGEKQLRDRWGLDIDGTDRAQEETT